MMTSRRPRAGGGWPAMIYTVRKAMEAGPWRLWTRMTSRNACKTCALGMGGQRGGMVNEAGHFPEVCKKSLQAQVADMQGAIDPQFFEKRDLTALKKLTPKQAEDCGRLSYPVALEAGGTHFKPISWDTALKAVADAFKTTSPEQAAFYSSGRSSNEAAFLLQTFARVYGSNNVMNCSFYCHQASGVGLKMTFGTGTATIELDDLDRADLVVLLGANPASNHPRLMTKLANLRARGGKIIVVNPVRESGLERFFVPSQVKSMLFGSSISTHYIQPMAGGDTALLVGVLKSLIESNKVKQDFLDAYTLNSADVLEDAKSLDWSTIETQSGVAKVEIDEMANLIAGSKAAIFAWAMGLTHHTSGVENILALSNVALATANIGRPGAGLLPIRGHSNVQGIGSVGFSPALQDGVRVALEYIYGKAFPTTPGLDTHSMMLAAERGEIKTLFALGGNLWGSNPDSDWATKAMNRVDTIVYLSTKLNPGHFHGTGKTTLILPVLARDEEPQSTTQESMFNYVRLSDGGEPNVKGQMRAESAVICDIANLVLSTTSSDFSDWNAMRSHKEIRRIIGQAIPGWSEIANIDETKKEFCVSGRIFHQPTFPTPSGKAEMHRTPLPSFDDGLRLITLRSEGQFNTVVYEEYDLYRGIPHRFCALISDQDAKRLNLKDGQRVKVRGESGTMENIEIVVGAIRAGNIAMYYPEANVLIAGRPDKRSGTPAFKSAPVWIEP